MIDCVYYCVHLIDCPPHFKQLLRDYPTKALSSTLPFQLSYSFPSIKAYF